MIRRFEGRCCDCCVLTYLIFSASFCCGLGVLSANFERSPSFLQVSVKSAWSFLRAYIRLSLLRACFILLWTSPKLSFAYKLPAGLHLALLQASFELASSIPLSSLQAYLQLPSGLTWISFGSLWGSLEPCHRIVLSLLEASFKLALCFLQAYLGSLQASSSLHSDFCSLLQTCFQLASCSLQAAFELLWSLLWACFRHSFNWEVQNLRTLVLCLACTGFQSSKP